MVNGGKINVTIFIINTSPYVKAQRQPKNKINRSEKNSESLKKSLVLKRVRGEKQFQVNEYK